MYYQLTVEEALKKLETSRRGLDVAEAAKRLEKCGHNELIHEKGPSPLLIFARQFKNFLVLVLIAATVISGAIGHIIDAAVILAIVVINAFVGFVQEYRAERAMAALKKMVAPKAIVIRDGEKIEIDVREVVPGDIVFLGEGEKVPADCRIIESISMKTDESMLTGESISVEKTAEKMFGAHVVGDQHNMVFMGTTVVHGHGTAIVSATGMKTEMGKIAGMLQKTVEEITPLQRKMNHLAKWLGIGIIIICALISVIGILKGTPAVEMFLIGTSLAVAAIPEGLPTIITLTLALGLQQMAKRNAIVRKLPAVETLGSATAICCDKTGTLTQNKMTVREIYTDRSIAVSGEGYDKKGSFSHVDEHLQALLRAAVFCNNASVEKKPIGDPTEIALLVAAAKAGLHERIRDDNPLISEIPFDSERKRMTVIRKTERENFVFSKGAPEILLKLCKSCYVHGKSVPLTAVERKKILEINKSMTSRALRVLAFAHKPHDAGDAESGLIFLGLIGMIDPPRPEAKNAVLACKRAGIKVIMITGDHKSTAVAIARELEIDDSVITGAELDKISDDELYNRVEKIAIYARISPHHKIRIVNALKRRGHIVAVTGDGINDAPALKNAHIGVAVGSGTDVAKEASDIVLKDDNFATIVAAIATGRTIFDNIRETIRYLLSCNAAEVIVMLCGVLFLAVPPLIPIQILWMNLITDGLPALALGMDPAEKDVMQKPPRKKTDAIGRETVMNIFGVGIIMAAVTLFIFTWAEPAKAITLAFTTLVFAQLFYAVTCRSSKPILRAGLLTNKFLWAAICASVILQICVIYLPPLQPVFGTTAIGAADWIKVLILSLLAFLAIESAKLFKYWRYK